MELRNARRRRVWAPFLTTSRDAPPLPAELTSPGGVYAINVSLFRPRQSELYWLTEQAPSRLSLAVESLAISPRPMSSITSNGSASLSAGSNNCRILVWFFSDCLTVA